MSILILLAVLVALYFIIYFFISGSFAMEVYPYLAVIILLITSFVKWKNERKFLFLWLIISVVFCFGKRYLTKPDDGYQWVKTNCSNCGKNVFCEVTYYTDYYPWREGLFIDGPFYICSDKCDELYREKRKEKNHPWKSKYRITESGKYR